MGTNTHKLTFPLKENRERQDIALTQTAKMSQCHSVLNRLSGGLTLPSEHGETDAGLPTIEMLDHHHHHKRRKKVDAGIKTIVQTTAHTV